jgi:integrase
MANAMAQPMPPGLPAGPGHPALLYRNGLMIAVLALRPLRQRNFLALELHRHLRQQGEGWTIKFPATETKTNIALEMPFPQVLLPALALYLEVYRPVLLDLRGPLNPDHAARPAGQHLWVSRCGTAMTDGALHKALIRHTTACFGHAVNTHLFRDCAATSLADEHPEIVRYAADLLGHKYFSTTETYYIPARQRHALRRYQDIIGRRRKAARRGPREGKDPHP